jgi:hypothetical protein
MNGINAETARQGQDSNPAGRGQIRSARHGTYGVLSIYTRVSQQPVGKRR